MFAQSWGSKLNLNKPRIQKPLIELYEAWNEFDTRYQQNHHEVKCEEFLSLKKRKDDVKNNAEKILIPDVQKTNKTETCLDIPLINTKEVQKHKEDIYRIGKGDLSENGQKLEDFISETISISGKKIEKFKQLYNNHFLKAYNEKTVTRIFNEVQTDQFPEILKMVKENTNMDEDTFQEIPYNPTNQLKIFSSTLPGLKRNCGVYASVLNNSGGTVDVAYASFTMDASFTSNTSLEDFNGPIYTFLSNTLAPLLGPICTFFLLMYFGNDMQKICIIIFRLKSIPLPKCCQNCISVSFYRLQALILGDKENDELIENFIKYKTMNAFCEAGIIKSVKFKDSEERERNIIRADSENLLLQPTNNEVDEKHEHKHFCCNNCNML